jgi:hypothetical protein
LISRTGPENGADTVIPKLETERSQVNQVLSSKTFARSPRLARLLDFVCRKYFDGQTDQLKEYTIGVELFGRPEAFQPRDDASIRVDMNRLRQQLQKYYGAEGKHDALIISIPSGQYVPLFSSAEPRDLPRGPSPRGEESRAVAPSPASLNRSFIAGLVVTGLIFGAGVTLLVQKFYPGMVSVVRGGPVWSADLAVPQSPAIPTGEEVRILPGFMGERHLDQYGHVWLGDRYFAGGTSVSSFGISPLFPLRQGLGIPTWAREGDDFTYHIPLKPGVYELRLHFVESTYHEDPISGEENRRAFDVFVNGNRLLSRFDIVADAGGARIPDVKVFTDVSPASDGLLHMMLKSRLSKAILSGIEVVPGIPGKIRPVRIASRSTPYTSSDGTLWSGDRFFRGGRLQQKNAGIEGTRDPVLYEAERYGHFRYSIPVADHGLYTMMLGFSETPAARVAGEPTDSPERRFNVLCNGQTLLKNFSILEEAGGADRALTKIFYHLEPSPQGKLVVDFVPVSDYACVSTIAVLAE